METARMAQGFTIGQPLKDWDEIDAFLRDIFGPWFDEGKVWTAAFADIGAGANWQGSAGLDRWRTSNPSGLDLYFCIGLMGAAETRRSNKGVVAQGLLIVDDVGTKVDRAKWDALFAQGFPLPTWATETSPGNETWGWALDGDAADPARWVDLGIIRANLVEQGLTDDVMDAARYVRLPAGRNSKHQYRTPGADVGASPAVNLLAWRPVGGGGGRVDLEQIGRVLLGRDDWRDAPVPSTAGARALLSSAQTGAGGGAGAGAGAGVGGSARTADMSKPDATIRLAVELGMNPAQLREGVVGALCPNIEAHSSREEEGFAFIGDGIMTCRHASCQGRSTRDFREMMLDAYDEQKGSEGAGAHFMARETTRDLGGFADTAQVMSIAARMSAATVARRAAVAAAMVQGLDGLAQRYARVNSAGGFFDTVKRRLIPDADIDTERAVVAVIPAGATGKARARNQLINHPDMKFLDGVMLQPGDLSPWGLVPDAMGVVRPMANIWVPSVWTADMARPRQPVEWLSILGHVFGTDVAQRDWLIDWFAFWFQNPGVRRMTIPFIVGGQGIGKDALVLAIRALMGVHNTEALTMAQIGGGFNPWMVQDLVILPELKLSPDGKMYNTIKSWLANTDEWVDVNEKYLRPYRTRVHYSLIANSNHQDALYGLEPDDRRWQIYISGAVKPPQAFFDEMIQGSLTDDALAGLLDFLLRRDLSGFTPFLPIPGGDDTRRTMLGDSLGGAELWAMQAVTDGGVFAGRNLLTLAELEDVALRDPNARVSRSVDARFLARGLSAAGFAPCGQVGPKRNRVRLWLSPDLQNSPLINALGAKDLFSAYLVEKENFNKKQHQIL